MRKHSRGRAGRQGATATRGLALHVLERTSSAFSHKCDTVWEFGVEDGSEDDDSHKSVSGCFSDICLEQLQTNTRVTGATDRADDAWENQS